MDKKMADSIIKHIPYEFFSGYLYLQMAAYFEEQKLKGAAHWMRIQSQEEACHGMILFNYLVDRGVTPLLGKIEAPGYDFKSPVDVFEKTLKHEQMITKRINELSDLAISLKDHATRIMLDWFVTEQIEEENSVEDLLEKFTMAGKDRGAALLAIDATLAARTFTLPPPLAGGV